MTLFSLRALLREAERTLEQRRDTYPRLVADGVMTDRTATLRLDQTEAIRDALAGFLLRFPATARSVEREVAKMQSLREEARRVGRRS